MLLGAARYECRTRDPKMREGSSVHNKMIDRNWVMKRKRKRLPCGSDLSNGKESIVVPSESPSSNPPDKRRLKGDSNSARSSRKKKGNDGYYFECVVCDLGGNLLCCDSCPRTYHLQCLNPPLKRTPPGKWQCPNCCGQNGSVKSVSNPESISKRARTKIILRKSKTEFKSTGSDKVSQISDSCNPGKNRSSSKAKSTIFCTVPSVENKLDSSQMDVSCRSKSSHSSHGGSVEGNSPCANIDIEKKPKLSCANTSGNRKASSPIKEVLSPDGNLDLEPNDEPSERNPDLPCNHGSPGNKLNPTLGCATQEIRKRKPKLNREGSHKKSRADKGKCAVNTPRKRGARAASSSPETVKPHQKRHSVDHQVSSSLFKEDLGKTLGIQQKDMKLPEETSYLSHELNELRVEVDKTETCEDNLMVEVQQVDRILGCRMCSTDTISSSLDQPIKCSASPPPENNPTRVASDTPSLLIPESNDRSLDDIPAGNRDAGIKDADSSHGAVNQIDRGKSTENETKVDKLRVYRRCTAKEVTGGEATGSTRRYLKGQGCATVNSEGRDESAANADDKGKVTEIGVMVEHTDLECINVSIHGNNPVPGTCETPNPVPRTCETPILCDRYTKDADMEMRLNNSGENMTQESIMEGSMPSDKDTGMYEFFVKWVAQSHIHNSWVSECQLKVLAKRKLENYKAKYGTAVINICQEEWSQPQRVIALRASKDGITEAFVKWSGLPYDECTWERIDDAVMKKSSHLIARFKQFDCQTLDIAAAEDGLPKSKTDCSQSEIFSLIEQPKELKGGSLFPHQLEALNWLRKCWHKSKNVILADEMGLGKTVSACAFMSSLYFEFKARLPCLVLVPLSTMPNWLSEFALWAPNLNVVEYHGCAKARSIIRQYEWIVNDTDGLDKRSGSYKFNVLLTTYEMVLADSSHLRGVPWEVLVVDEGHRLKNAESKLFSLLNTFSFQHRVLLTGTPLQNNIGEMYNLLNFLQPASFPSLSSFEEKFNDLTTAEKAEELKKLVAPHMLRRLKKDVMQNIPPKTERMVPVELSSIQAEYYRAMLTKNYQILRNIEKGVPQQSMLNIVMQLRKVCNHPYLIPGTEPDSGSVEFLQEMRIKASAKLTLLHSMLKLLNKEGHRVLIFSQMTKLLDILEDYLTVEFGTKTFERVDGSVSVADRQTAIARFNQDKSRFVFLLSTRSCGLGINLATADTVIIYDSDFNPHADIQAMNRAHRIGQTNRLLVYRLVVRASVEERILQLAKKKLMLDQLFVNKSESQKEVEDILRWGTEELFSDSADITGKDRTENSSNKDEAITDIEHKHRRRAGGLGDVYKDKCTDGSTKILWDENAILRLLDRSILQSGASEGAEGDLENDMLGSVKSLEWNDEATEEQGRAELPSAVAGDVCAPSSERKEDDVVIGIEENEWDRLLRVRWEKFQNEEEAALGRGKRLRKAVSYSEAFIPHPSETLSESGNEAEEPEPEREYTPAGRALKEKFARLRARQKERLAQRNMTKGYCPTEGQFGIETSSQFPATNAKEREYISKSVDSVRVQSSINLEDRKFNHPLDAPKNKSDSTSRLARVSKQGCKSIHSSHLDLSVRPPGPPTPDMFITNHQFQSMSYSNSVPNNNLLPVLGLCAPNANQLESAHRSRHESYNVPRSNSSQSRAGMNLPEFPFGGVPGAGTSGDMEIKGQENAGDACMSSDFSRHLKRRILDGCFPFSPYPLTNTQGRCPDPLENPGSSFPAFREKMALPNLAFEEQHIPKFSLPAKNVSKAYPDLFPSLSLGTKVDSAMQDLPTMPLLPNFRLPSQDTPKQNRQVREVPPTLSLGQVQSTYSSLPDNHKKVLDNIMMRTGSGATNLFKKRLKVDAWSEDELDALWIGVRRHGRGNWDAMLRDPKLKFSKHRTSEDMSLRWEKEQVKFFDEAALLAPKSSKSTSFLGISDGMMTRALHGSRLAGPGKDPSAPPKFRTHLTDMQLGYGDLTSGLLRGEHSDHFGLANAHHAPLPAWKSENFQSSFIRDFPAGPSDRPVTSSNLHLEQPFLLNSLGSSTLGSLGMNCSSSCDLQQQDEQGANKYVKLPSPMQGSLNSLHTSHNNTCSGDLISNIVLPDPNKQLNVDHIPVKDHATGSNSPMNKLPHWLREAVSVPARPPEPFLPPTVSAIAHSVRLLYGEEKSTIPPFTVPGPPPCQPKDPRRSLKKKWRLHKLRRMTPDMATSSKNFQNGLLGDGVASGSIPSATQLPASKARTSRFPWIEPNFNLPSLNLNLMSSESSSSYLDHLKKPGMGLSPSPEVLQLVASCVAAGPHISSVTGMASSSFFGNELPLPKPLEPIGQGGSLDLKDLRGKQKARQSPLLGKWGQLPDERTARTESGDSSKTHSDPRQIDPPEVEEISSEETVSDDHGCEQEP